MREVLHKMVEFYSGEPKYIQHFIKVHAFASEIAACEKLDEEATEILQIAAYVHDIGIKPALQKHGSSSGKLQEKEGPDAARKMLESLHLPKKVIERVCYLVAHHHTYTNIDADDYQILVEADFLVNFFEGEYEKETIEKALQNIFKTQSGKRLCKQMFLSTANNVEQI